MLTCDWLEQTDKIGCNIFPARMTCAELCCQIVWEHFPQLCVEFQPWRRQLGSIFYYDISKFLKWGILNAPICSIFISFHFYLVMTLVVPRLDNKYIYCFADLFTCKKWCNETFFFGFGFPKGEGEGEFLFAWAWFVIIV